MDDTEDLSEGEIQAMLAESRGWEIAFLRADGNREQRRLMFTAVGVYAGRLEELVGPGGSLPIPEAESGSQIDQDDDRELARRHSDLTVNHQAGSRLFAAFDHLAAHSARWQVHGELPPFHAYPEFTLLRAALEAAASAWWILEPPAPEDRVMRALASKRKEADYEYGAAKIKLGEDAAEEFQTRVTGLLSEAAREVSGSPDLPRFPGSTKLVDGFGGEADPGYVGLFWRECSSYAHGFDWASWHHRGGEAVSEAPHQELAEVFVVACGALQKVWTQRWLPLALAEPPEHEPRVFLPGWPVWGN